MFCEQCGEQLEDGARFCPKCGAPVSQVLITPTPVKKTLPIRKAKPFITAAAIIVVLCIIGAAAIALLRKPMFERALLAGDYKKVISLYDKARGNAAKENEYRKIMEDTLENSLQKYASGEMDREKIQTLMDTLEHVSDVERDLLRRKLDRASETLIVLDSSKDSFQAAEKAMEEKAYPKAIEAYGGVMQEDTANYKAAQEKTKTAKEAYEAEVTEQVNALSESGDYEKAYDVVEESYDVLWDDAFSAELFNIIYGSQKDYCIAKANEEITKEHYLEAVQILDQLSDHADITEDESVISVLDQAVSKYTEAQLAQAQAAFASEGYESAIRTINPAKNQLEALEYDTDIISGCRRMVQERIDDYYTYQPVDLTTLEPYLEDERGGLKLFEAERDTLGNIYDTGLYSSGFERSSSSKKGDVRSSIYAINGKYNLLTAKGFVGEKNNQIYSGWWANVRIYGDNILLFEKTQITSEQKPYDISVDITGVNDLKIEIECYSDSYLMGEYYGYLGNVELKKTVP